MSTLGGWGTETLAFGTLPDPIRYVSSSGFSFVPLKIFFYLLFILFIILGIICGMWDLSSSTRDQTQAPRLGSTES